MLHSEPFANARRKVRVRDSIQKYPQFVDTTEVVVEDWWDRVIGKSWMHCDGNPVCLVYAVRSASARLPFDNEVVYAKAQGLGVLVHVSEIIEEV